HAQRPQGGAAQQLSPGGPRVGRRRLVGLPRVGPGADQRALRVVAGRVLLRRVAEPPVEGGPPDHADRAEDPERLPPARALGPPASRPMSKGASAPHSRADIQIVPWARARSWNGNQAPTTRARFG